MSELSTLKPLFPFPFFFPSKFLIYVVLLLSAAHSSLLERTIFFFFPFLYFENFFFFPLRGSSSSIILYLRSFLNFRVLVHLWMDLCAFPAPPYYHYHITPGRACYIQP